MNSRLDRIASLANIATYDAAATREYVDGAPHIKHKALRELYGQLLIQVFEIAHSYTRQPRVLDLGAGEGAATLPFLELGASVVAVDISSSQLNALKSRCKGFEDRLELRCENICDTLELRDQTYDIIVANSFLHHIPDYLGMLDRAIPLLRRRGQFFSFQDPMRYDTLGRVNRWFSQAAYLSWRLFRGDVIGGLGRTLRRSRGVYLEDSRYDNAEYHVMRNGVDQLAIARLFARHDCECRIVPYFSTQNRYFQSLGDGLGMRNTFAILAQIPGELRPGCS